MIFVQAAVQTLYDIADRSNHSVSEMTGEQLERRIDEQADRTNLNAPSHPVDNHLQSHSITSAIGHNQTVISSLPPPPYNRPSLSGPTITHIVMTSERGAPPPYEDVTNPNAPPPSYDSLFGRVRDVHKSSSGMIDFFKNLVILLLGTIGCSIIVGVTVVIPISMIIIGSMYLYDCPQGEYIPVYLLVGGGFGVLKQLLHLSSKVRQREEEQEEERLRQSPTQTLLNCFMLGWFIIGSIWVYKEYEPNYDPSRGAKYCNRTLYLFAFWLITSVYVALGMMTLCLCSVSIATIIFSRNM